MRHCPALTLLPFASLIPALLAIGCDDAHTPITHLGTVHLVAQASENPKVTAKASFYPAPGEKDPTCTIWSRVGSCELWACDESLYVETPPYTALTAGTLIFSGARQAIEVEPTDAAEYSFEAEFTEPPWDAGDPIAVDVTGSKDFPPLSSSVFAPPPVTVTAPSEAELTLKRDEDFPVTWDALSSGKVYVTIATETQLTSGERRVLPALGCSFSAANGAASIPAAVMKEIVQPASLEAYLVDVLTRSVDEAGTEGAALIFQVTSSGYSGRATLE